MKYLGISALALLAACATAPGTSTQDGPAHSVSQTWRPLKTMHFVV